MVRSRLRLAGFTGRLRRTDGSVSRCQPYSAILAAVIARSGVASPNHGRSRASPMRSLRIDFFHAAVFALRYLSAASPNVTPGGGAAGATPSWRAASAFSASSRVHSSRNRRSCLPSICTV